MSTSRPPPDAHAADEERVYGLHAALAVFRHRRQDIRRVYIDETRVKAVGTLLRWCAKQRVAYHVVGPENLERVTRSTHHEGICLLARIPKAPSLDELLAQLAAAGPQRLLLLEDVRDPHNVGAILRTAAHFGVRGALLVGETAPRSAALLRTAEGGAEEVQLIAVRSVGSALTKLTQAGYTLLATTSHTQRSLYDTTLPERVCVMLGSERDGVSQPLLARAGAVVAIPGTGAVESLNVATAAAVVLAELWRQRPATATALAPAASDTPAPSSEAPLPEQRRAKRPSPKAHTRRRSS